MILNNFLELPRTLDQDIAAAKTLGIDLTLVASAIEHLSSVVQECTLDFNMDIDSITKQGELFVKEYKEGSFEFRVG
jgi:hypothetical protein